MNFAVIGSAHGHIKEFIEVMLKKKGNFVGILDDGSELCRKYKKEFSVPLFENIEEILEKNIDIAGTSAVNNKKIEIIDFCSRYETHIIADKPIVVNENQYKKLENIIQKGNIEVGLMLTLRFDNLVARVNKLIKNNVLGRLLSVEIMSPHQLKKDKRTDWHFNKEENGGIIIDLMIHSIDLFHWFTESKISNLSGTIQKSILKDKKNFYDNCQFVVESQNGVSGYLRVDWHMSDAHWSWGDLRIFCIGTEGSLEARVTGDPITKKSQIFLFKKHEETKTICADKEQKNTVIEDFVRRIEGKSNLIGHQEIIQVTKATIDMDRQAKKINLLK